MLRSHLDVHGITAGTSNSAKISLLSCTNLFGCLARAVSLSREEKNPFPLLAEHTHQPKALFTGNILTRNTAVFILWRPGILVTAE